IHYNVTIDGVAGTAAVQVTDNGEPGRNDTFEIVLSNGDSAGGSLGGDRHGGGNIQLHKAKCGKGNGGQQHNGNGGSQGGNNGNNNGGGTCDSKPAPTGKGGAKCDTEGNSKTNNGKSDANKGKDSGKPAAN